MSKSLRLSEKWFNRGLWLVALVFAGFLIGLGGTVVGDLPKVENQLTLDAFMDQRAAASARTIMSQSTEVREKADLDLQQAMLGQSKAAQASQSARETYSNWIGTRQATQRPDQDGELIARTQELDNLKKVEREWQAKVQAQRQVSLDARQAFDLAQRQVGHLEEVAREPYFAAVRALELRVFLYRLALTLPLLLAAAWLFAKKRKCTYWPFVWGFGFFALFAFFVELVPYLPSYGGYVRYVVGIAMTVVGGRYAVQALQRYKERQALVELKPEVVRRVEMSYETSLARLAKGVCPGCERPVDLKNSEIDFCPHCGIGLYDHCGHCSMRKSAFSKFCHGCGTSAKQSDVTSDHGSKA